MVLSPVTGVALEVAASRRRFHVFRASKRVRPGTGAGVHRTSSGSDPDQAPAGG